MIKCLSTPTFTNTAIAKIPIFNNILIRFKKNPAIEIDNPNAQYMLVKTYKTVGTLNTDAAIIYHL